jgi:exodeoxyribonuclease V gamma subunit
MHVHRSNRAEALVGVLAEVVSRRLPDPLARECIVVQGRGMERWLSMELARRLGVWANPDFPFPRKLIRYALRAVLRVDDTASACFEPEILMWSVADLLGRHLEHAAFGPIRTYLANDERQVRRIQLAERIARTFDQYVVYRPQMVRSWEGGRETHWQAVLWRAVVERHGAHHVAAYADQFLQALDRPPMELKDFPRRVSVFGVSTLAPLHLEMLAALAKHVTVHLFLLSPSAAYWADIRSRREVLRTLARHGAGTDDIDQALHLEEGTPLLASLGRSGRDFQLILEGNIDYQEDDRNLYVDPGTATMVTTVQSDMLALRHRRPGDTDVPPLPLDPRDDSITIHACHAPMREVEVLHDQLLAWFDDRNASLEARDVLIMSPAIDAYAPLIDAVFGGAGDHTPRIPYRIADRTVRATDDVVNAFLTVIATLRGRMTASDVLDLLGLDLVRDRFGFVAEDLDVLRGWITQSGVRWGIDAAHRQQAEQPPLPEHTWRFGLDRLLLGYALPGKGRRLYGDVLPYDDLEGTSTELLGRLCEFCEALFTFHASLRKPRTLDAWRDDLGRLLSTLVASSDHTAHQHRQVRDALAELAEHADAGLFHEAVDLDTVQLQLGAALEASAPGRGFLTGAVTFCALVPMRSIPFRVVGLLGMNDADFPRARRPAGFDLMAQQPMPGDRSSRNDDRYLFLEALLSARERIIITYVGQSVRDNSALPPSVVVSDLLDVLGESFRVETNAAELPRSISVPVAPAHEAVRGRLVVRHPLQPFSPRYFGTDPDRRLFSYAQNHYEGARALTQARGALPPFLPAPLPPDAAPRREVALNALIRFFENPTRAFLQDRLSLFLGDDGEIVEDREPLELDTLAEWKLGSDLLERALAGENLDDAIVAVRASGALPPGMLGQCTFEGVRPEAVALAEASGRLMQGQARDPLTVAAELDGADTRITGVIRNLWPAGQVHYQFSTLGRRHELTMWIRHLVLNWARPKGFPCVSFLVGRPQKDDGPMVVRFRPVDNAAEILRGLLALYRLGQQVPLLLFERASRAYAELLCHPEKPSTEQAALKAAQQSFDGNPPYRRGDLDDAYVRHVFSTVNPLDPDFQFGGVGGATSTPTAAVPATVEPGSQWPGFAEVALAVFVPLLDHREEMP